MQQQQAAGAGCRQRRLWQHCKRWKQRALGPVSAARSAMHPAAEAARCALRQSLRLAQQALLLASLQRSELLQAAAAAVVRLQRSGRRSGSKQLFLLAVAAAAAAAVGLFQWQQSCGHLQQWRLSRRLHQQQQQHLRRRLCSRVVRAGLPLQVPAAAGAAEVTAALPRQYRSSSRPAVVQPAAVAVRRRSSSSSQARRRKAPKLACRNCWPLASPTRRMPGAKRSGCQLSQHPVAVVAGAPWVSGASLAAASWRRRSTLSMTLGDHDSDDRDSAGTLCREAQVLCVDQAAGQVWDLCCC